MSPKLICGALLAPFLFTVPARSISLWDTRSPLADAPFDQSRAEWKQVPSDLFQLEKDPAKARSDPGYYGREYRFTGDAVIENEKVAAAFAGEKGSVFIFARGVEKGWGAPVAELRPLSAKNSRIQRVAIVRDAGDEILLEAEFQGGDDASSLVQFAFGKDEIIEIKPGLKQIEIAAPLQYGVVPAFGSDDLIFGAVENAASSRLVLPADGVFVGLLAGENSELVLTWPKGGQRIGLNLADEKEGRRALDGISFQNDGQSIFLAPLAARGIWHKEPLTASFLEQDIPLEWKPPFPARWQTQLDESGVKTTFAFREAKGTVWRGVPGSYDYPVWFDGDRAKFHLSKKVPPKGEALIYFLEGKGTPLSVLTPADVLRETLGRSAADTLVDSEGRKPRTHHRRGGEGVRRACTCGCTEAIQACFEAGDEVGRREYISGALDDMVFFVQRHIARIDEYRRFADDAIKMLESRRSSNPELKEYIDTILPVIQRIPDEYANQLENMKSLDYARALTAKTMALTEKHSAQNLTAYMELLKAWRGMGGAQDYIVAQCHAIARQFLQEAGYACAAEPKALALAREVRASTRRILRNPDGYEIWPNY